MTFIYSLIAAFNLYFCYVIYRFSRATYAKFEDIKRQSASGFKDAIEQHKYTEFCIDIKPSYVIIPYGGRYKP